MKWIGILGIYNSTISSNSAELGGGVYNEQADNTTIYNTIIADNLGRNCSGIPIDGGHNIDTGNYCHFNPANGSLINTNPLLGYCPFNGGFTLTIPLLVGSPAIDAADPVNCPTTDQRVFSRPVDGDLDGNAICDIGAFEYIPLAFYTFLPTIINKNP